jgi:AcrR family transcriptional regulator
MIAVFTMWWIISIVWWMKRDTLLAMSGPAAGRPRRAPAAADRRRDPERTRAALLDAALQEFAAKGRAGARVSEIAARAGVDKQLISYYFGGKDGLYQALVARWLAAEDAFAAPDVPLPELVARYVLEGAADRDLARLLVRVALDDDPDAPGDPQQDGVPDAVADLRRRQEAGEIAPDLDPAFLLLLFEAAAAVGVIFPGDVRRATGLDPQDPEFAERYAEQLRRVVRRLAGPPPP